jgi:hypothetical protein
VNGVTYADLLARAETHTSAAWSQLNRQPFLDPHQARQAVSEYRELVHALAVHARSLADPPPVDIAQNPLTPPDPLMRPALRFAETLEAAIDDRTHNPENVATLGVAAELKTAAVAIGMATDLLATHTDPAGHWRTPESVALADPTARLSALDQIATLAIGLADARPALVERLSDIGVSHSWSRAHPVPDLAPVRESSRHLRAVAATQNDSTAIMHTTVANPGIRIDEPLNELTDRLTRIRVRAWQATVSQSAHTGILSLIDFADAAVILHVHAGELAARIALLNSRGPQVHLERAYDLFDRVRAWRHVTDQLHTLTSSIPRDPVLTEDVQAVQALLAELTRSTPAPALSPRPGPRDVPEASPTAHLDQLLGAVERAVVTFEDIPGWNARTLQNLHVTGNLQLVEPEKAPQRIAGGTGPDHEAAFDECVRHLLIAYVDVDLQTPVPPTEPPHPVAPNAFMLEPPGL